MAIAEGSIGAASVTPPIDSHSKSSSNSSTLHARNFGPGSMLISRIILGVVANLLCFAVLTLTAFAAGSVVAIPLDKNDSRFGSFYVKELHSFLVRADSATPTPAIIFMHGCGGIGGLTLKTAKSDAAHWASLGIATLILDTDDDRILGDRPCNDRATSFSLLDARRADLDAAVKWLVSQQIAIPDKIVSLGTSHGGSVVIEHAFKGGSTVKLAGGIAYYGACDDTKRGRPFARYPLLLLTGGKDFTDGPKQSLATICSNYAVEANRNGGSHVTAVTYPDAAHSFDVAGEGMQVSQSLNKSVTGYDPKAAAASMAEIDKFLGQVLK